MSFDSLNQSLSMVKDYKGLYFKGTVLDNKDPLNLDRIRIKIPDLYEIEGVDLPWALPNKNSLFGNGDGWGTHGSPAIGSTVLVELQNGDPHYPVYTTIKDKADAEFPSGSSWGFKDPKGNKLVVDLAADKIVFSASSGVTFTIEGGNLKVVVNGNLSMEAKGKTNLETDSLSVSAKSGIEVQSPNTHLKTNLTVDGSAKFTGASNFSGDANFQGTIFNNEVNIGNNHKHRGVKAGSDTSGNPV
jgi:hypothetical protein